jgi:high affinity Mn2+ porin
MSPGSSCARPSDWAASRREVEDGLNSIAGRRDISRITVTAGKFAAPDIFDDNRYAHDPRTTFLNWSIWEAGAWDYPADQKGYTDGIAVELNQRSLALRGGWFIEPTIANPRDLDPRFWKRFGAVTELELRHERYRQPGSLKLLASANRAHMGNRQEAADIALATGAPADITAVRRDRFKYGFAVNLEQAFSDELGGFARASWNDGRTGGLGLHRHRREPVARREPRRDALGPDEGHRRPRRRDEPPL